MGNTGVGKKKLFIIFISIFCHSITFFQAHLNLNLIRAFNDNFYRKRKKILYYHKKDKPNTIITKKEFPKIKYLKQDEIFSASPT